MKKSIMLVSALVAVSLAVNGFSEGKKMMPGDDDRFTWSSMEELSKLNLKNQSIEINGPWTGPQKEIFEHVISYFEDATGAKVNYAGSDSFEQQIVIDLQAGGGPDIAIFPQPGLARDMASKGFLEPLPAETMQWVEENYAAGSSWVDLGTMVDATGKDEFFGFFYGTDVKSLVWYSPENFSDAGYEVPTSMEQLKELTTKIAADGNVPWCIGIASGAATGWPATDWIEDLMLRTSSLEDYDKWTTNELAFNDPKVVAAIEEFGWFVGNDKYVDGGSKAVSAIDYRDSPDGIVSIPPKCYLHRQASFIGSFFPEGTEIGEDVDFFYFPAYEEKKLGSPVLGSGTVLSMTRSSEAALAFMAFLQTPLAHELWMDKGGFVTPHKGVNTAAYATETLRKQGAIMANATSFRFDGSDLMPGKIGAGAFWTGMVNYVGGQSAKEVADGIQKSWDDIK